MNIGRENLDVKMFQESKLIVKRTKIFEDNLLRKNRRVFSYPQSPTSEPLFIPLLRAVATKNPC